jgi:hypothetical protein
MLDKITQSKLVRIGLALALVSLAFTAGPGSGSAAACETTSTVVDTVQAPNQLDAIAEDQEEGGDSSTLILHYDSDGDGDKDWEVFTVSC